MDSVKPCVLHFVHHTCCLQAVYRLLARRWQNRLNALLGQQEQQVDNGQQQDDVAEDLSDLVDLEAGAQNDNNNMVVRFENRSSISGLRAILQQLNGDGNEGGGENNSDEEVASGVADEEEHEADDDIDNMEEDDTGENHRHSGQNEDLLEFLEDDSEDEFASLEEEESTGSVVMEDVNVENNATVVKGERAADQPRTISMSSDDL